MRAIAVALPDAQVFQLPFAGSLLGEDPGTIFRMKTPHSSTTNLISPVVMRAWKPADEVVELQGTLQYIREVRMSRIIANTQKTCSGPWLLSTEALESLDVIFDELEKEFSNIIERIISERLSQFKIKLSKESKEIRDIIFELDTDYSNIKNKDLSSEANENNADEAIKNIRKEGILKTIQYKKEQLVTDTNFKRNLTIRFKSNRYLEALNFKDISESIEIENELIDSFDYTIRLYDNSFPPVASASIKLENCNVFSKRLIISTSPTQNEIANSAYGKLINWANKYKLNSITRFLNRYSNGIFLFLNITFPFSTWLVTLVKYKIYSNNLQNDALHLIKDGIDNTNINKAIEILLKNEFKIQNISSTNFDRLEINVLIIIIFIYMAILALIFTPRTCLQIGEKGISRYKFWKWWHNIILIAAPGTIALGIIVTWISTKFL